MPVLHVSSKTTHQMTTCWAQNTKGCQGYQLIHNDQEANLQMALNQALKKEFGNPTVLLNAVT